VRLPVQSGRRLLRFLRALPDTDGTANGSARQPPAPGLADRTHTETGPGPAGYCHAGAHVNGTQTRPPPGREQIEHLTTHRTGLGLVVYRPRHRPVHRLPVPPGADTA